MIDVAEMPWPFVRVAIDRNAQVVDFALLDALKGLEGPLGTKNGIERADLVVLAPKPIRSLCLLSSL